ncbi:MAG: hypothetical protein WBP26_04850 [Candidatus Saccharimonadales bacterium]
MSEHASIVTVERRIARTAGKKAATAFVVSQAVKFGDRYQYLLDSFRAIVETTGHEVVSGGIWRSEEIVIQRLRDGSQHNASRVLSGRVRIDPRQYTYVETNFYEGTSSVSTQVADEWFDTRGNAFGGGTPFLDDPTGEWVLDPNYHGLYTETPAKLLESAWQEVGPKMDTAQDTQALLWESVQNPALNYDIASAALLAHHDLRAGRELTRR